MAKRDMVDPHGATITALRQGKGLSRVELARRVRSSYSHIYNLEKGHKQCTPELAALIARELEVSVERIIKRPAAEDAA